MKRCLRYALPVLILFTIVLSAGDDLEDKLSTYKGENGKMYLQPLADTFGANLNSGMSYRTKVPKIGLNISLDIIAMGAMISDEQKSFMMAGTTDEVPTIFGTDDPEDVSGGFSPPPGIGDIPLFPTAAPQLNVGSIFGTQASIRWMKFNVHEDIGDFSLVGFGLRHSIDQYIPLFPIDITATFFTQTIKLGDVLEGSTQYIGVNAGYKIGVLSLYGGIGFESASFDVGYKYEDNGDTENISFSLDAVNSTRMTFGFSLNLLVLKVFADYNIADQNTVCAGVGFGF